MHTQDRAPQMQMQTARPAVMALAAIPETVQAPAATRKRRSGSSDERALSRAEQLKGEKLEGRQGTHPSTTISISMPNFIFDIPIQTVTSNLDAVSISLGSVDTDVTRSLQTINSVSIDNSHVDPENLLDRVKRTEIG